MLIYADLPNSATKTRPAPSMSPASAAARAELQTQLEREIVEHEQQIVCLLSVINYTAQVCRLLPELLVEVFKHYINQVHIVPVDDTQDLEDDFGYKGHSTQLHKATKCHHHELRLFPSQRRFQNCGDGTAELRAAV